MAPPPLALLLSMVRIMPKHFKDVPLPLEAPTTEDLREACSAIIRDLTAGRGMTDIELGGKLNVHANTIAAWRNKKNDMGALMIATIGAKFGADAVAPYNALYGATAHGLAAHDAAPLTEMADALSALVKSDGPKARMDALPTLKAAHEALGGYLVSLERWRAAA